MKIDDVKRMSPRDRFLYWIRERESIRLKKESGLSSPWTDDAILATYRFCNVRRMDDRVSRWLLDTWYVPYRDHPNMLAAVALARFVNRPEALARVTDLVFRPLASPAWDRIKTTLRNFRNSGGTVFNGAYMVRGNSTKSPDKIGTVINEYVGALLERDAILDLRIVSTDSMEATHSELASVYGFGSFMAGQVVADLRHAATGSWSDRLTWAPQGPGSLRGLNRLYSRDPKSPDSKKNWDREFAETLELVRREIPASISDRLEAMDVQNCLCEFDKYNRALNGEGKPKQLYKPSEGT